MDTFLNILVQGTLTSATLALVALGFSLVYGVGGIVNLAHGSFFMVGAYGAYASATAGVPIVLALVIGVLSAAVAGVLLDRLVIKPMGHQEVAILIATLAAAILTQSVVTYLFGTANRRLDPLLGGSTTLLGVDVLTSRVVAGVISAAAVATVLLVLAKTPVGRTVRAVAQDPEAATLVGIRPERVTLGVMALGGGLAGLAGVLVAPFTVVQPAMWLLPLTQAFAIVILGGLGSIGGTVLAAVIVGYLDRTVAFTLPDGEVKIGLVTIVVILGTLILRPSGLLGKAVTR